MHKYRVRITKLLNTWVEVEADTLEAAEEKAFDRVDAFECGNPQEGAAVEWRDDHDLQVESGTAIEVDGIWEDALHRPVELGGGGYGCRN